MRPSLRDSTSPAPLGIGLIGVGRHGSRYLQHLVHDLPDVALAAVCRKNGGGTYPGTLVPVYDDYRAMIADPRVQAVVVVTPPSLCHDICLTAVGAGKAILIEKPLAPTGIEARAMVDAASRRGVVLMTAHTLRFDPTIALLHEQLRTIGTLRSALLVTHIDTKANVASGRALGALLELGVHLLDLVRFLSGQDITEAQCTMSPLPSLGPETQVKARLRTSGGIICDLDISRVDSQRKGTAEWLAAGGTLMADWVARTLTKTAADGTSQTWSVEPKPTVLATLRAFVSAIRTATPPPITGLDGCLAVEAADACYRSAVFGGATVSLRPD